jgi:hypothetical protein
MKLRNYTAIASLIALAAPLPIAFWGAFRFLTLAPADVRSPDAKDMVSDYLLAYGGAILIGFVGFLLAGFCLDALGMRPSWYLRSLCIIGVLWLLYFPAGTMFGACLLFYLLMKHLSHRRADGMNSVASHPQ